MVVKDIEIIGRKDLCRTLLHFQTGAPDDKSIGDGSNASGGKITGVWTKRHDTYQKNCAVKTTGKCAQSAAYGRKHHNARASLTTEGRNDWQSNMNWSMKNQKGIMN